MKSYTDRSKDSIEYMNLMIEVKIKTDSINEIKNHPKMIQGLKKYSIKQWKNFENLLGRCKYWEMNPHKEEIIGTDGWECIIEAHQKDKYWFVDRWAPEDDFSKCGEYLIKLSGLKD